MTGPFATATEFCEFTGMTLPNDLARLQSLLEDASAEIRGYTGQTLSIVLGDQFTSPAWASSLIVLPERPVTAVTSVVVDAVTVPVDDYLWTRGGHVWTVDGTSWGAATVTYTHGYAEMSEEFERIKTICIQAASRAFTMNKINQAGSIGSSEAYGAMLVESGGYAPEIFLTPGEQMRLSDYCAAVFA